MKIGSKKIKNNKNVISVIISNKKGRKLITDLSNQTFKDYELIVIKDENLKGQSWTVNI
mgnify:FL=1